MPGQCRGYKSPGRQVLSVLCTQEKADIGQHSSSFVQRTMSLILPGVLYPRLSPVPDQGNTDTGATTPFDNTAGPLLY